VFKYIQRKIIICPMQEKIKANQSFKTAAHLKYLGTAVNYSTVAGIKATRDSKDISLHVCGGCECLYMYV
jgi:hypothetical protein